jgi:hypothetical protein
MVDLGMVLIHWPTTAACWAALSLRQLRGDARSWQFR